MADLTHIYAGAVKSMDGRKGGIFRRAAGEERWEALTDGLPDGADSRRGHAEMEVREMRDPQPVQLRRQAR